MIKVININSKEAVPLAEGHIRNILRPVDDGTRVLVAIEDVDADLNGQRLAGRHHAVAADHLGAAGEHAPGQAVTSGKVQEEQAQG